MPRKRKQEDDMDEQEHITPALPPRHPMADKLRRMRERAGVTRYFIGWRLGQSPEWVAWVEDGYADVDYDALYDAYTDAITHLHNHSLPAKSPGKLVWSVISSTNTKAERAFWGEVDKMEEYGYDE